MKAMHKQNRKFNQKKIIKNPEILELKNTMTILKFLLDSFTEDSAKHKELAN